MYNVSITTFNLFASCSREHSKTSQTSMNDLREYSSSLCCEYTAKITTQTLALLIGVGV